MQKLGTVRRPQTYFEYTLSGRQAGETIVAKVKKMPSNKQFPKESDPFVGTFVGTFVATETIVPDIDGNMVDGWEMKLSLNGLSAGDYIFNEVINGVVEEPVTFTILEAVTQ